MPLFVVILAAGQGKRMKSELPKVLQPLAGRPLLAHVVATARSLDPVAIHVVHGHGAGEVRAAIAGDDIRWALQAEQKGTGHAVAQAMPGVPDGHDVLVLYGDVPLIRAATLRDLMARCGPNSLALLSARLPDPAGYGRVVRDAAGRVTRIVEERDASPGLRAIAEINTGVLAAPAARLRNWLGALRADNVQGEYYLTDCIGAAVQDGCAVEAIIAATPAEVLGVNDKVQLAEAEAAHRANRAQELMHAGVTVVDPARLDVRGDVACGRDVVLDVNVILEGKVRLGDRVKVGANCVLRDCEIGDDSEVRVNSLVEGAVAGRHCVIGPFARLRPGTRARRRRARRQLRRDQEQRARRRQQGEPPDLSRRRDDRREGERRRRHDHLQLRRREQVTTVIDEGAFIGSDTMLVAPVSVGEGAAIGAGTTITKPAPAGKLTVERSRQVTVESWKRPEKSSK